MKKNENKYLDDEKVKRNIELYKNNKEQFLKEAEELTGGGSFTSLIKEILKNRKEYKKKKKKNHKSLKTK